MFLHVLLLVGLSIVSNAFVWSLLRQPWRPTMHPVSVPDVLMPDDYTFDHRGLC